MEIARRLKLRATFEIPLLLFLASAANGAALAFDHDSAWARFAWIASGLALAFALAHFPERIKLGAWNDLRPISLLFGLLPSAVAIYFFLSNDWTYRLGKISWLDPTLRLMEQWQPDLRTHAMDSNSAGGVIAAFLPLQVAALMEVGRRYGRKGVAGRLALIGTAGLGLLLSESRGAWLALGAVAVVWWLGRGIVGESGATAKEFQGKAGKKSNWGRARVYALAGLVGIAAAALMMATPLDERILGLRPDRLAVWRNSLDLAGDYAVTGLGLDGFAMAYSSYALLVHVPHTEHAHNLLLDIHLQQGALGLVAFLWWVGSAVRSRSRHDALGLAALASLGVILLHGLLDDAFYGYGGEPTLLLFLPFAALARTSRTAIGQAPVRHSTSKVKVAVILAGAAIMLIVFLWLYPRTRAVVQANMGALAQTQAELSVYRWPEWSFQDEARRSSEVDLAAGNSWYESALASDPSNATANRRMGQIELSRGQYQEALEHLEVAYSTAPEQRATRQMLGEAYAVNGEIERAIELWRTIDIDAGQLELRRWWYAEYLRDRELAERMSRAMRGRGR